MGRNSRSSEDEKRKKKKKKKHHKRHRSNDSPEPEKKHHKKRSTDERKSDIKRRKDKVDKKRHNKDKLISLGDPVGKPPAINLDADDYFAFHQHLFVYLFREEGVAFNDLSSEDSRAAFARFIDKYNVGDLEAAYYDPKGLPDNVLEESKSTRHSWKFRTSETEEKGLRDLAVGIRKQTEYEEERTVPS